MILPLKPPCREIPWNISMANLVEYHLLKICHCFRHVAYMKLLFSLQLGHVVILGAHHGALRLRFTSMDVNMDGTIQYDEFLDSWSWQSWVQQPDRYYTAHTHIPTYVYCIYNGLWICVCRAKYGYRYMYILNYIELCRGIDNYMHLVS